MSPTYAQNKRFAENWKRNNINRYREIVKVAKRKYDAWKKIQKVYLGILLI